MFVARVQGTVWATRKVPSLEGKRLLLVQRLSGPELTPVGESQMAVCDGIDAGIGDTVLVIDEGNSARQILGIKNAPIRTVVIGVVDAVTIAGDQRRIT